MIFSYKLTNDMYVVFERGVQNLSLSSLTYSITMNITRNNIDDVFTFPRLRHRSM